MSWKDNLRPGSFKGVPFGVDEHEADVGGLRVITHVYPKRDTPYAEENGRKPHSFTIEVFVLGDDYMEKRDALIDVCNQSGAGKLVHPWLGSLTVFNTGCRVRESKNEGRMARFSLSFVESGKNSQPQVKEDLGFRLDEEASQTNAVAARSFSNAFSLERQPGFVRASSVAQAQAMIRGLEDLTTLSGINSSPATQALLDGLRGNAGAEISSTQGFANSTQSVVGAVAREQRSSQHFIQGLTAAMQVSGLEPIPLTTATRRRQAANRTAMERLFARTALIETVRGLPQQQIESQDDAFALKNHFGASLDKEIDLASEGGDFQMFDRLAGLRAVTMRYLDTKSPELARKANIVLPATRPALVMAYKEFGTIEKADEITRRNSIAHPGFAPGGVELEVLRNG